LRFTTFSGSVLALASLSCGGLTSNATQDASPARDSGGPDSVSDARDASSERHKDATAKVDARTFDAGVDRECFVDGAPPPVVLATGQSAPDSIAVDDSSVYWRTIYPDSSIERMPKTGGSPQRLSRRTADTEGDTAGLVIVGKHIYWAFNGAIVRQRLAGGPEETVFFSTTLSSAADGLTANSTSLFMSQDAQDGITEVFFDSGVPVPFQQIGAKRYCNATNPATVVADDSNVYWLITCYKDCPCDGNTGAILSVAVDDSSFAMFVPNIPLAGGRNVSTRMRHET
jgi:hypothetical protein